MKIYWSILTSRGYPTKEDKLREEEEYLRQLEKIRLMLGAEKESDKREEEFKELADSVKKLHEIVSIKRADCEKQIKDAQVKIKAAREEYAQALKRIPNYYFRLEGHGEDWGDFWCEWYYNGKTYHATGTTVYERDWIIEDEGQNFTDFLTGEH